MGVHLGIVRGALQEWGATSQNAELLPFSEPGACKCCCLRVSARMALHEGPEPSPPDHHVTRFGGDEDHEHALLGGDKHVSVAEPVNDDPFHNQRGSLHIDRGFGWRGEQHLVAAPEVQSEGLGPLDKSGNVRVAAQQIVEELAACRLLLSNHLPPGGLMALDQHLHRIVDHPQDSLRAARTSSRSRDCTTTGMSFHSRQAAERATTDSSVVRSRFPPSYLIRTKPRSHLAPPPSTVTPSLLGINVAEDRQGDIASMTDRGPTTSAAGGHN